MKDLAGLREQVATLEPVDQREADSLVATLARLDWPGDPFDEAANEHHVTE